MGIDKKKFPHTTVFPASDSDWTDSADEEGNGTDGTDNAGDILSICIGFQRFKFRFKFSCSVCVNDSILDFPKCKPRKIKPNVTSPVISGSVETPQRSPLVQPALVSTPGTAQSGNGNKPALLEVEATLTGGPPQSGAVSAVIKQFGNKTWLYCCDRHRAIVTFLLSKIAFDRFLILALFLTLMSLI